MSLYDYKFAQRLEMDGPPFCSLIMAAMRRADPDNLARLRRAFPAVYQEHFNRFNAPDGVLPEERDLDDFETPRRPS